MTRDAGQFLTFRSARATVDVRTVGAAAGVGLVGFLGLVRAGAPRTTLLGVMLVAGLVAGATRGEDGGALLNGAVAGVLTLLGCTVFVAALFLFGDAVGATGGRSLPPVLEGIILVFGVVTLAVPSALLGGLGGRVGAVLTTR
jgi:hypothetical protein